MQQVWNKSAAVLLCALLALVCSCGGGVSFGGGGGYPPPIIPIPIPDPPDKQPSQIDYLTDFVDEVTWETNRRLSKGEIFDDEPLVKLDFGSNRVSPLRFSNSYGNVIKYSVINNPKVRLYSKKDSVSFVVFNFDSLPQSQFISYVEVKGDADFNTWQRGGFALGMRHGNSSHFLWSGPVGSRHNWIFSYGLHQAQDYQGGVSSIAIAVANGDVMRVKQLRIVVSEVGDHLRRDGQRDPHFTWPYAENEFYDSRKVGHFYNGNYHSLVTSYDPWSSPYQPEWRDYPNPVYRTDGYWSDRDIWKDDNLNKYDVYYQIDELEDEITDLKDLIDEITVPEPVVEPPPFIAPPGTEPTPAPVTQPVIKSVPVL